MKKIVILIPTLTTGGGEKIATENANDLSSNGYDVTIIVPRGNIQQKLSPQVTVYSGSSRNLLSDWLFCREKLNKVNPDVVLSYMERANFINIITSWQKKWRIITSIHTVPSVAYKKRGLLNRIFIFFTMKLIKINNIPVICVSKGIMHELNKKYRIKNNYYVPNYLSVDLKKDITHLNVEKNIVFGFVGRLSKIKGCDIFIDAILLAIKEDIAKNKIFWIIGDGIQKDELLEKCKKEDILDRIKFWGNKENTSDLFREIDYLVIPSYVEGFGLVILEGLYYGCNNIYSLCKYGPAEIMSNFHQFNDSYAIPDPSINRATTVKQLSQLIKKLNNKKNLMTLQTKREIISRAFSRESSLKKMLEIIEKE
ncbi:TPA: glycosyltransferase [Proteus mirabilis]|nr:glycosyltransferase [Proteus mirabilis]